MFALQPKPTFEADVFIPVPGGEKAKVTVIFKHKGKKALAAYFDSLTSADSERSDADALDELIDGWKGVDEKYSKEKLELMLDNYPGSAAALFEAYRVALVEGRRKN